MEIYRTVTGSRLYGIHNEYSDYDYRGVRIEPLQALLGVDGFDQEEIIKDGQDIVIYGLRKFAKLVLANNPNIMDILFAPEHMWVHKHPYWDIIHYHRNEFLSQRIQLTFTGYAHDQLKKIKAGKSPAKQSRMALIEAYGYDTKDAAHVVRLLYSVRGLIKNGTYDPVLSDIDRNTVLSIKQGSLPLDRFLSSAEHMMESIRDTKTKLPERGNVALMNKLLIEIYSDYIIEGPYS